MILSVVINTVLHHLKNMPRVRPLLSLAIMELLMQTFVINRTDSCNSLYSCPCYSKILLQKEFLQKFFLVRPGGGLTSIGRVMFHCFNPCLSLFTKMLSLWINFCSITAAVAGDLAHQYLCCVITVEIKFLVTYK